MIQSHLADYTKVVGSFALKAQKRWNNLPEEMWLCESVSPFYNLKHFLHFMCNKLE